MNVIVSDELKTALVTYPKCGSNTLQYALGISTYNKNFFNITWKEHILLTQPTLIADFKKVVPLDYRVIFFTREPVDRWISGFVFLCQTNLNLFHSDLADFKKQFANASDDAYFKFFDSMMKVNDNQATLCDMHMTRYLYPLLIIRTLYDNSEMVDVSNISRVLSEVHDTPYVDFGKMNSADKGYSIGFENSDNQDYLPEIKNRFHNLLYPRLSKPWDVEHVLRGDTVNAVRRYLHLESLVYRERSAPALDTLSSIYINEQSFLRNGIHDYGDPVLNIYHNITWEYQKGHIVDDHIRGLIGSNIFKFRYFRDG